MTGEPAGRIRVLLVDDQPLVRLGLATLFDTDEGIEVVGEASDGRAALDLIRRRLPQVVLMDVRMPVMDGLSALREISAEAGLSTVRVIMLTTFELDEYVFEALGHGAAGFVLKDGDPDELLRAVRVVAAGGSLLSPSVTRRVVERFRGRSAARAHPGVAELTQREREMVAWVATGRSNDEIARELTISTATVRTHVSRAMLKMGARDRAQLVVFAVESGLRVEGQGP